jgi:hypothetical protein
LAAIAEGGIANVDFRARGQLFLRYDVIHFFLLALGE